MPPPTVVIDLTTATPPPRSPVIPIGGAAPPIANPLPKEKEEELTLEAVLQKEIATVREGTLRGLLQKICNSHPEAAQMAADVLLVQERDVRYLSAEESTEEEEEKIEGGDKKEKQGNEDPSTEKSTDGKD
ncbi:hypothetical protein MMC31_007686 [Peltigera leucophlebia]|nr:hypothetical protein [Peltigera leucophlebia]